MTRKEQNCVVKPSNAVYQDPARVRPIRQERQHTSSLKGGGELSEFNAIQLAHLLAHMGY